MSFPAPSAFPDGKIVSDSLPADLWTFLQTSCDFPAEILRISSGGLLQGQADGKGDPVVRAGSPDRPAEEGKDFLGYGQAKARAARAGGAGAVQTEELFKDPVQFLLGDVLSRIGEGEYDFPGLYPSGNFHRAVRQAIIRRVAQEIISSPCQLVGVRGIEQHGRQIQAA